MRKQWLIIGLVTMVLLSGCTINITKNVTEPPNREALSTEIPTPTPAWETETAPISGGDEEYTRANVHLTNVEEYVVHTVRPIYYDVMGDSSLGSSSRDGKTWYYKGDFVVRLQYHAGTGNIAYERNYYYNPQNDELIFAFVFLGKEEYRYYFYKNSLVRYIGPDGVVIDNPTDLSCLKRAEQAILEAFQR